MLRTDNPSDFEVYSCAFEFHIQDAEILIKFPCTYTFELKSMDNKLTLSSTKNKVSAANSIATFNEKLRFETDLLYSRNNRHFISKEILLIMNLISLRRPDQQKMVGRVTVNLVDLIENAKYSHLDTYKLDYCSVNVNVRFYAKFMGKKISHTLAENFDRDSFSDFQSFVGGSKLQKNGDDTDKTLEMGWKIRTNENLNVIVEQDKNEDKSNRRSARTSHKIVNSNSDQNLLQMIANSYQNQSHEQESKLKEENLSVDRSEISKKFQSRSEMPNVKLEHQYEEIMKGTRLEEKRIWEEEKKFLSEQISKEKEEVHRLKEKNEILERKVYENELKICSMEGRIESCRREMTIVEKEKSLEVKELEVELEKKRREIYEKSSVLTLRESEIKGYVERIEKYEDQFREFENIENRQQYKDLAVRLNLLENEKLVLFQKIQDLETLMVIKNNELDLNNQLINDMSAIENINLELSAKINALNNEIDNKNREISENEERVKGETEHLVSKIEEQKEYISGLEKEVLLSHEKTSQYIQEISDFKETVTNYTTTIEQLKEYSKNLEQEVLNQTNIKESPKEKVEMERYAFIIDSLNIQVNEMNIEIEKLNREKEESKEYILELEKNILNREDQAEETDNINTLKEQEIIHLKEYQKGIETELISMHDQIEHKPSSELLTEQTQVLNRIAMLEETIEEQKIYAKHLEEKILEDHNEEIPSLKKIEELQNELENHKEYEKNLEARILEMAEEQNGRESKNNNEGLESMLEEQKLYVKNLESKILDDHINEQNYIDRINALEEQFHMSKEEQRKLELKEFESCKRIEELEQKLFHQREYQEGLEERILNDHQNISNEHELKNSICLLKDTIKQQKEYQEGLEERILYDHQDKENGDESELKQSLNIMKSQLEKQKEYQEGLEEKILQDYHYLQTQQNENVNVSYEGEVNQPKNERLEHQNKKIRELEDTITQKEEYIAELEANLSAMQREIYCLEERIQEISSQNVERGSCKGKGDGNESEDGGFGTIIRVISVHSEESDKDDDSEIVERDHQNRGLDSLLKRGSIAKSQISQPPSLREREEISDDLSYQSSPRKNKLEEIYGESPNRGELMTIRTEKEDEGGLIKTNEFHNNEIDVKEEEIRKFKQSLHTKEIELLTANKEINLLKTSNEKLMKKSHEHSQFQSSFSKLESKLKEIQKEKDLSWEENKTLQRRLNQVEKELQLKITQISELGLENERLLKSNKVSKEQEWELEKINQEYEIRIKMLKEKELKIEEALVIIEEESVNIANELELRETEKEEFKVEIEILQQRIVELERNTDSKGSAGNGGNKMNYSAPYDMSFKEDFDNLMAENQKKDEEIHALKKKISIHSENSLRYESLLAEIEEKHHENESRETYIKGLEEKLRSYEGSSISNKLKNKENKSEEYLETRVEELEEELFSLKANENEKDLEIHRLKNEISDLKQSTPIESHPEAHTSKFDQTHLEITQLKTALEHERKLNVDKLTEKENKLIGYQKEFAGLQNILELERAEYESKINEAISYNDKALKTIEELDQELSKKEQELQEKEAELEELKGVYLLTQKEMTRVLENEDRGGLKIESSGAIEGTNFDELKGKIEEYENEIEIVNKKYNEVQLKLIQTEESAERGRAKINELQIQIESINIQKDDENKSHLSKSANLNKKKLEQEFENERQSLLTKIEEIQHEFNFAQKSHENSEKESISKISSLEDRLRREISEKEKAIEELEEKQMEHLNLELDLHFKLREKTEKSQIELAKSIENPNRKSFNVSQEVSSNDLIPASKTLKEIISSRSRGLVDKRMEAMVVRIAQLEEQIYSNVSVSKEKGLILEKTRLMSMEFSKLKVSIMKGKLPNEDRMKLLTALRPIENTIKDILKLSEIHSENLLSEHASLKV